MSVQDLLNYDTIQGGKDTSGFSADQNGNLIEILKYIIANTPGAISYRNTVHPIGAISGANLSNSHNPLLWDAYAGLVFSSGFPSPAAGTSVSAVYDSTLNRWYARNTTGAQASVVRAVDNNFRLHPYGPHSLGLRVGYDLDSGQLGKSFLPADIDCVVMEWEGTFTAAIASDDTSFLGISDQSLAAANSFANARRCLGVARRSGGSGWVLRTSDGTTASETAEAADTSDGNRHIFRIEWHAKATPEARLYVDGILKVTKTTNLPALSHTVTLQYIGLSAAAGLATDRMRWYSQLLYWKNAA